MSSPANIAKTTYGICMEIILLGILSYHLYRTYINNISKKKSFKRGSQNHLIYLSLSVIIWSQIFFIFYTIYYPMEGRTPSRSECLFFFKTISFIASMIKFSFHLFVCYRCYLIIPETERNKLKYKIGFAFTASDLLFGLYLCTPLFGLNYKATEHGCILIGYSSNIALVWYMFNDFIIGIYGLFIFIRPIYKLIKITNDISLKIILKRVVLWSTIGIISTLLIILASAINSVFSGYYIFPFDYTLNALCVIMQFPNIKYGNIVNKKIANLCDYLHCGSLKITEDMELIKSTTTLDTKTTISPQTNSNNTTTNTLAIVIKPDIMMKDNSNSNDESDVNNIANSPKESQISSNIILFNDNNSNDSADIQLTERSNSNSNPSGISDVSRT